MTGQDDRWPNEQDAQAGSPSAKAAGDARRVLILYATGILMLVAWQLYRAWTEPLSTRDHLLHALLFSLVAVLPAVSRQGRDSVVAALSKSPIRRRLVALWRLVVLALFGWSQLMLAHQREAERQLALKREPWRQEVERQRDRVNLAEKRVSEFPEKGKAASEVVQKSWREVRTAGGKREFHADPAALQKLTEAVDESGRAMNISMEEQRRLFELERTKPDP
jgi:hypothetical protein